MSAILWTRRKSPYTNPYRALVSSLAPSVRPRCHSPYSSHEWFSRKAFSSSALGWLSPQSLLSTYWWPSISRSARATARLLTEYWAIGSFSHETTVCHASESVRRMREGSLAEDEHLRRRHGEDQGIPAAAGIEEAAVADLVVPASVPLVRPRRGQARQHGAIGHRNSVSLDHHVEALRPRVAPGRQHDVTVDPEVHGLLLGLSGGEVNGVVEPHGDQRGDMGSTVGPHRRDPEQLRCFQDPPGLTPRSGRCFRVAETSVDGGARRAHPKASLMSLLIRSAAVKSPALHRLRITATATPLSMSA